jgi:FkbM family methyltransferase
VDADPGKFARLQQNARRHSFHAYNVVFAAEPGELTFVRGAVSDVTMTVDKANDHAIPCEQFVVDASPLSSFKYSERRLMVKIDVEGQESDALVDAPQLLENWRIVTIYVDRFCDDRRVLDLLRGCGFAFHDGVSLQPILGDHISL